MTSRIATNITELDSKLEGGVLQGSLVTFEAPLESQGDKLLNTFMNAHDSLYISTQRSEKAVRQGIERDLSEYVNSNQLELGENIDISAIESTSSKEQLVETVNTELTEETTVLVIDTIDTFEDREGIAELIQELQDLCISEGIVCYLYRSQDRNKSATVVKRMSDTIFTLRTHSDGTEIMNRFSVPKIRGGPTLDETLKLDIGSSIQINLSRDIA